jgi:DNA-binding response OmpR family regulator
LAQQQTRYCRRQAVKVDQERSGTFEDIRDRLALIGAALMNVHEDLTRLEAAMPAQAQLASSLKLDGSDGSASIGSARVYLTKSEFALLKLLASSELPLTRQSLYEQMYPSEPRPVRTIITVYINHVRRKLRSISGGAELIETLPKYGYRVKREWV